MKKIVKKLSVVTLVLILCLSLCSCSAIDEMRKTRASYIDKERTKISYKGETFVYVENWNTEFDTDMEEYISVSDKEVPLLLTEFFGDQAYLASDSRIICVDYTGYYCREDVYEYAAKVKEKDLTYYCYDYYDEETEITNSYLLKDDFVAKIDEIIKTQKADLETPDTECFLSINKTDAVMLMRRYYVDINVDTDGKVTISYFDEEEEREVYYPVPQKYQEEFSKLVEERGLRLYFR